MSNNNPTPLKIKFITYDVPTLNEEHEEELKNFITLLAQQGFKDNIVNGSFPRKVKDE